MSVGCLRGSDNRWVKQTIPEPRVQFITMPCIRFAKKHVAPIVESVGLVVRPVDLFGPVAAVTSSIDGQKDNPRARFGEFLAEMWVGHRRALRIGPHVITNQATDLNSLDLKCAQRTSGVGIDFAFWRIR